MNKGIIVNSIPEEYYNLFFTSFIHRADWVEIEAPMIAT